MSSCYALAAIGRYGVRLVIRTREVGCPNGHWLQRWFSFLLIVFLVISVDAMNGRLEEVSLRLFATTVVSQTQSQYVYDMQKEGSLDI